MPYIMPSGIAWCAATPYFPRASFLRTASTSARGRRIHRLSYTCRQAYILYLSREINLTPQSSHVHMTKLLGFVASVSVAWTVPFFVKARLPIETPLRTRPPDTPGLRLDLADNRFGPLTVPSCVLPVLRTAQCPACPAAGDLQRPC
jgi:hypothetical protein